MFSKTQQRFTSRIVGGQAFIVCFTLLIIGCEQSSQANLTPVPIAEINKVTGVITEDNGALNLEELNFSKAQTGETSYKVTDDVPYIPILKPLAIVGSSRVQMKLLIISANGDPTIRDGTDPGLDAATYFAEQIGIPYDVMIATSEQLSEARLVASNGDGKYQAIVLTNGSLTFNNAGVFESTFDTAEWNLLWQYMREFNVRQLSLDSFPGAFPEDLGLREATSVGTTVDSPLDFGITSAGQEVFSSLKSNAQIPIKNAFVNLATICTEDPGVACPTGVTTTPILRSSASNQIVGTVSTTADNRQILSLTMGHNFFLTHTALLSYDLFNWVTQGVFIGAREMYLQLDVDDWYQESVVWNPATNANRSETEKFKISGLDTLTTRDQLNELRNRFPIAPDLNISNAIVTFPADLSASVDCSNSASLEGATLCVKDDFDWFNHTYTERPMNFESPGYNNAADNFYNAEDANINSTQNGFTCNDSSIAGFNPSSIGEEIALKELVCNNQKLLQLGIPFNPNSVVTSAFSGLGFYNTDPAGAAIDNGLENSSVGLMEAVTAAGIRYMASNHSVLSQRGVCEVCGRQHPNYPQIFLIPRYPTFLFFNTNEPAQVTSEFNFLFGQNGQFLDGFGNAFFDRDLSYQEILDFDAEITLRHVTSLQQYMHFFHQNNLRNYSGGAPGRSLLYDWIETFLELYSSYYSIPLLTLDWSDQALNIERRTSFFNSDAQGVWDRATGEVTVTSGNGGFVFVTNAGFSDVPTSSYGGDVIQKFALAAGESRLNTATGATQNPNPLPVVNPVIPTPVTGNPVTPPTPTNPNTPPVSPNPVTPTPTIPTPVDPNNLLVNGSFENSQAGWSGCGVGQARIVSSSTAGGNALNLSGISNNGACLYQEVPISAGQSYTLVCDAKRNTNSTWSSLTLSFNTQDYSTEFAGEIKEITGTGFSQIAISATAPAGAARASAVLYSEDDATIDNCVLTSGTDANPTPTPNPTPSPIPVPSASNALVNGDFENGRAAWINCSTQGISNNSDAFTGEVALRVRESGCVYQEVIASAGSDLTFSCQAKREDTQFANITFSYLDRNFQSLVEESTPITSTNYQNYSISLTAPANTEYAVATFYSESTSLFDTCTLTGVSNSQPQPIPSTGNSQLTNGGFENQLTGWESCSTQGFNVDSEAANGSFALRVANSGCVYQELETTAGAHLSLDCQAKNDQNGYTSLTLSYLDSNFELLQEQPVIVNSANYQIYRTSLVAPANARYAVATLYSDTLSHFDSCKVTN